LDELLLFLNELLPDWPTKNSLRYYAHTDGRGRNQFTFHHPMDERKMVRVSIPSDMTGIEVTGTRDWFDSDSWEKHDIVLDCTTPVV
jgi:hypothetical protein